MSSPEIYKIVGALLLGGMVVLASGILADFLVKPRPLEHAAAVEAVETAPAEAVAETAPAEEPAAVEETAAVPAGGELSPLLAAADPAAGEKLGKRCATCHTFDKGGANKIGPNLWDVVGARHARAEGFKYSAPMAAMGDRTWDYAALDQFLASPKTYVPGTKMTFAGLKKPEERAAIIRWLREKSDAPKPLP